MPSLRSNTALREAAAQLTEEEVASFALTDQVRRMSTEAKLVLSR